MKRVLFVVSHLCSGSSALFHTLDTHPRIQMANLLATYTHPFDLGVLTSTPHKNGTTAAYWGDHLLFNYQLGYRGFYETCKFVYVIRQPKATLNEIMSKSDNYSPLTALRYYSFRLRRMYEMAACTPDAVLARRQHIVSGAVLPLIEDYLDLDLPLRREPDLLMEEAASGLVPDEIIEEGQDCFEKYYYLIRDLGLKCV